jgi:hypothetical protein
VGEQEPAAVAAAAAAAPAAPADGVAGAGAGDASAAAAAAAAGAGAAAAAAGEAGANGGADGGEGAAASTANKKPAPAPAPQLDAAAAATMKAMTLTAAAAAPLLDDPDAGVREASAELMGLLREAATVGALYKLNPVDPPLESAWFQPLNLSSEKLVSNFAFQAGFNSYRYAPAHVDALQARMSDGDEAVRDAAMDALARLGYYNPLTGSVKSRGFYRTQKPRARGPRLGPDGKPIPRKPISSLSRRVMLEVGATIRVWWPDDMCFYEARVKAWDRETDVHTLLYVEDGIEEDLDLKKERVELRYKPHKRGAKETWMAVNKKEKDKKAPKPPRAPKEPKPPRAPKEPKPPRAPKEPKPPKPPKRKAEKPPKPEKPKPPKKAKVTVEPVPKGAVVDAGTQIRVWWPLDEAWYGGEVKGYKEETNMHTVGGCVRAQSLTRSA